MARRLIGIVKSTHDYPLPFKQLLHASLLSAPDQDVVYRDQRRRTYREARKRVGGLASAFAKLGVSPSDTVGVMEWDSHRSLKAAFAASMMGAGLTGSFNSAGPDSSQAGAQKRRGSWRPDWGDWLHARLGEEISTPTEVGSERSTATAPALMTHVFDR